MNEMGCLTLLVCVACVASSTARCSWTRREVRILIVVDDKKTAEDFRSATSESRLNSLYSGESDLCVPNMKFSMLSVKDNSDEITTIQKTYNSFTRHSYCIVILASASRKTCYVLEYAKLQHIPVISIVPKVRLSNKQN